jgi:hypothetical protein
VRGLHQAAVDSVGEGEGDEGLDIGE